MKKFISKKFISALLVLSLLLAFAVPAMAASVGVSTTSITVEKGKTATFSISASDAQAWATVSSANPSVASVNVSEAVWVENSSSTITVTGKSVGKTTITVNFPDAASADGTVDLSGTSRTITVNVVEPATTTTKPVQTTAPTTKKPTTTASTAANLKSLKVDGFNLNENFSGGRTSYSITVPKDTKSINVSATPLNSNCTVTGTGTLNITGLPQTFQIVCKAPNGETKTYNLTVNSAADPVVVNLTDLTVSVVCALTPEFDPSVYEYTATVPAGTKAVNVDAVFDEAKYEGAKVEIVGADDLAASNNTVTVTVTAKDGTENTYTIHIEFADEEKTVAPAATEEKGGVPVWVVILLIILLIVCSILAFIFGKKKGQEDGYDDYSDDDYDDYDDDSDDDLFIHTAD